VYDQLSKEIEAKSEIIIKEAEELSVKTGDSIYSCFDTVACGHIVQAEMNIEMLYRQLGELKSVITELKNIQSDMLKVFRHRPEKQDLPSRQNEH
jgi:hypothetical protein